MTRNLYVEKVVSTVAAGGEAVSTSGASLEVGSRV